ncbi:MAG: pyruvate ferredoxin oxidoreductase [Deltaproteobacteria bacterium HGW-Deltaproteobacteria-19]|jgi:pyruvate ferredoxin oxidoreductase delta subunit|nr:MAG: pyruvate ferredoxin oxidoreductase [Deltaproteobacteria bacterium HGW-Deltaproteobacteria-19]
MEKRDENISAMCKPSIGEAGRTGDWRTLRPVIDQTRCIPSVKKKSACFLCWLYCPEGVVKAAIPVEIDLDYCKGCGICAEECPAKAIQMVREDQSDE